MASHLDVTRDTGMKMYFCDPERPSQRGSNENTNGLLRQYFPKFLDLSKYRPQDLIQIENELNNRPRFLFGDKPPVELFDQLLAFPKTPAIAMITRNHLVVLGLLLGCHKQGPTKLDSAKFRL